MPAPLGRKQPRRMGPGNLPAQRAHENERTAAMRQHLRDRHQRRMEQQEHNETETIVSVTATNNVRADSETIKQRKQQ